MLVALLLLLFGVGGAAANPAFAHTLAPSGGSSAAYDESPLSVNATVTTRRRWVARAKAALAVRPQRGPIWTSRTVTARPTRWWRLAPSWRGPPLRV